MRYAFFLLLLLLIGNHSAGLEFGKPIILSQIGEPLAVSVPIKEPIPGGVDVLFPVLAPRDIFEQKKIERSAELSRLTFEVVTDKSIKSGIGLLISTKKPWERKLLEMIVEVYTPTGSIMEELRLEIPIIRNKLPANSVVNLDASGIKLDSSLEKANIEDEPVLRRNGGDIKVSTPEKSIKVKAGATLNSIAREIKPTNASLNQVLVSLLQRNPEAFLMGNINFLEKNSLLFVPSQKSISKIKSSEADRIVSAHMQNPSRDFLKSPLKPPMAILIPPKNSDSEMPITKKIKEINLTNSENGINGDNSAQTSEFDQRVLNKAKKKEELSPVGNIFGDAERQRYLSRIEILNSENERLRNELKKMKINDILFQETSNVQNEENGQAIKIASSEKTQQKKSTLDSKTEIANVNWQDIIVIISGSFVDVVKKKEWIFIGLFLMVLIFIFVIAFKVFNWSSKRSVPKLDDSTSKRQEPSIDVNTQQIELPEATPADFLPLTQKRPLGKSPKAGISVDSIPKPTAEEENSDALEKAIARLRTKLTPYSGTDGRTEIWTEVDSEKSLSKQEEFQGDNLFEQKNEIGDDIKKQRDPYDSNNLEDVRHLEEQFSAETLQENPSLGDDQPLKVDESQESFNTISRLDEASISQSDNSIEEEINQLQSESFLPDQSLSQKTVDAEAAHRLDLARSYQEMGMIETARDLLEVVASSSDSNASQEARLRLSRL